MILRFPTERCRKPSPYLEALMRLAQEMQHCSAVADAIADKLRSLPSKVVLWDEDDRRPCDG